MTFAATMVRVATAPEIRMPWEMIGRDQVACVADRPTDLVAGPKIEHAFGLVAHIPVEIALGRDDSDLVPFNHVARGSKLDQHSLVPVAAR